MAACSRSGSAGGKSWLASPSRENAQASETCLLRAFEPVRNGFLFASPVESGTRNVGGIIALSDHEQRRTAFTQVRLRRMIALPQHFLAVVFILQKVLHGFTDL